MQEVSFRNTENDIRIELRNRINCLDKEVKFRQDFNAVYPRYLPALRQHCPDLTHTDELIAMLLLLEQNNDEIALTLGVTKASVNKARSRMRKRLGLVETGVVLEDFLKDINERRRAFE